MLCHELGMKVNFAGKIAESSIATAALLHLAAAAPSMEWGLSLSSQYLAADVARIPVAIEEGHAAPPPGPGLGVEVDEAALAEYRRSGSNGGRWTDARTGGRNTTDRRAVRAAPRPARAVVPGILPGGDDAPPRGGSRPPWAERAASPHALVYGAQRSGSASQWLSGWPTTHEVIVLVTPGEPLRVYVQHYNHVPLAERLAAGCEGPMGWCIQPPVRPR